MTIKNSVARKAYENSPEFIKDAVDQAASAVLSAVVDNNLRADNTDLAENLVTEIFLYVCESNGIAWEGFAFV